jgi:nucleoside-diphosphate-sugar epimerase
MKVLCIGGTGTISAAISRRVLELGWELFLLNRGNRGGGPGAAGAHTGKLVEINGDIRAGDDAAIAGKIQAALARSAPDQGDRRFDVVADFIAFTPEHVSKAHRIFANLCKQYIFISSASAYQKPPASCVITESTPLANPFWQYSRDKIACENFLMEQYRQSGFSVTIVRPSHTYDERSAPLGVHGKNGSWQVLKRILERNRVRTKVRWGIKPDFRINRGSLEENIGVTRSFTEVLVPCFLIYSVSSPMFFVKEKDDFYKNLFPGSSRPVTRLTPAWPVLSPPFQAS